MTRLVSTGPRRGGQLDEAWYGNFFACSNYHLLLSAMINKLANESGVVASERVGGKCVCAPPGQHPISVCDQHHGVTVPEHCYEIMRRIGRMT